MSETLLTQKDLCQRLRVGRSTLGRLLPGLKADGLQEVRLKGRTREPFIRYRAASLDSAIERAAKRGDVLGGAVEETAAATQG